MKAAVLCRACYPLGVLPHRLSQTPRARRAQKATYIDVQADPDDPLVHTVATKLAEQLFLTSLTLYPVCLPSRLRGCVISS